MAQKRFHINEKGNSGECNATKRPCPLGFSAEEHFPTEEAAREAYERKQAEQEQVAGNPLRKASRQDSPVKGWSGPLPSTYNGKPFTEAYRERFPEGESKQDKALTPWGAMTAEGKPRAVEDYKKAKQEDVSYNKPRLTEAEARLERAKGLRAGLQEGTLTTETLQGYAGRETVIAPDGSKLDLKAALQAASTSTPEGKAARDSLDGWLDEREKGASAEIEALHNTMNYNKTTVRKKAWAYGWPEDGGKVPPVPDWY